MLQHKIFLDFQVFAYWVDARLRFDLRLLEVK